MKSDADILKNLRKMLKEHGVDSFHILEEHVPIEEQMEYFRFFDKVRNEKVPFERDEEIVILYSANQPVSRKKKSLIRLATLPEVAAYRAIETYHSSPHDPELENWAAMALVGSKVILSSTLSGEQQVYVSSGLGGLDMRLRFFALFATKDRSELTDVQKELIEREFRFQLQQAEVDIEDFTIKENYFTLLMLFPLEAEPKISIDAAIEEINKLGNFLDRKFLFTNIKILNEEEIQQVLERGFDALRVKRVQRTDSQSPSQPDKPSEPTEPTNPPEPA